MKRMADFIVNKRNIILIVFLMFAVISIILSNKVKINHDISKYLPNSSETRIGMNLMEKEFAENSTSSLLIMFKDLKGEEKNDTLNFLKDLDGVENVLYDESENYNKNNNTLYNITIKDSADSKLASSVYKEVEDHFENYDFYTSGDVSEQNKVVLPTWILALAVSSALVILIVMSESYVEPFLFLATILIAVLLNNGTNIIFSNVSNITNSISAILQMALSMDYSIMLMNRYQQEKNEEKNKKMAMKKALYNAFKSISSSSITTIVGLIALVFMSFTIGRDLGFVLAKGVLFSLLSIFTCLPAFILMFDNLITKTKKKSPIFKLNKLGSISFKFRYLAIILFILAFGGSYLLKGNLGILYTDSEDNEINKVFKENNQIAVIYSNKDEKNIKKVCKTLENLGKVDQVLCYGNTINEDLKYNDLNAKLEDLGSNMEIEEYLLKLIYYYYYGKENNVEMTFDQFISFIQKEVYQNEEMNKHIDNETKENISKLNNFTNKNAISKKRTEEDIAGILGIDSSKINESLIYYNSKNNKTKLTLNEFISFMNNFVLKEKKYASSIDNNVKNQLKKISSFTDKKLLQKSMSYQEMAMVFGLDENVVKSLYLYYISVNEMETTLTINEFANFMNDYVLNNNDYKSMIDDATRNNINSLINFSNLNIINKEMNSLELSQTFGIKEDIIKGILLLNYSKYDNGTKITIKEFVNYIIFIKNNTNFLDDIDTTALESLALNNNLMMNSEKYTATELANLLGIDNIITNNIYAFMDFINGNTTNWVMSPYNFTMFILNNLENETISSNMNEENIIQLKRLEFIMQNTLKNIKFNYESIANFTEIDKNIIKNIYSLYVSVNTEIKLDIQEFINFVLRHQNDNLLASNLTKSSVNELIRLQKIVKGVINNAHYTTDGLANLFGMKKGDLELIYSLYDINYLNKSIEVSLKDYIYFLVNDIMNNNKYSSNFDNTTKLKIEMINKIMNSSLSNIKYNKNEIYGMLQPLTNEVDKNLVDLLFIYYGSQNNYNDEWFLTVEKFINFLNNDILNDSIFNDFIVNDMRDNIKEAKESINDAKSLLIGNNYSRVIINTKLDMESEETFKFLKNLRNQLKDSAQEFYIIGNSPMAYEMSQTFASELDFITILTMLFIFVVVAFTFKSLLISIILVILIQCAVYLTMGILSFGGGTVYFISLLIVQSILMGATIDYAILYTSYYLESRNTMDIKDAIINSYNKSIHTILTSASILILVTLIVGNFASAIAAKICKTLSEGTLCASLLILLLLPAVLGACDKFIVKKKTNR